MNVFQRLNKARREFHALKLNKSGHNKFAGYRYFELADFLIPALKVFDDNGLCAVVSFTADTAFMEIRCAAEGDQGMTGITITSPMGSAALKGCHEVQNIGAVETYQRRYLWMAALEIVEHDGIDSSEPAESEPPPIDLQKLAKQVSVLIAKGENYGAFETLEMANLTNDDKLEIWKHFDSNERSILKEYSEAQKKGQSK